ncbi:MFS transporter [Legionella waltersii]
MTSTQNAPIQSRQIILWLVGVMFLLFQFFLQLSSGIVIGAIMHEQHLSALNAGLLSSSFYYVYTSLQIPVGILFDRYNARWLITINACLCALGCFLFASGESFGQLILGRLVIGMGSAFAFVGLSHQLREHFPIKQYAFMIGLSETLGFTLTVIGMIGMGSFITQFGWRSFIYSAGFSGFIIAFLCWLFIPNSKPLPAKPINYGGQLLSITKNGLAWINGLFVCLEFSVITVFSAMWAVPFLQLKMNCSLEQASILTSMTLLGAGLSCPVLGYLSTRLNKRKPIIHFSCLSTALLLLICLYSPIQSYFTMGLLLFTIGLTCGAYMLAYSISNELAPAQFLSTCTGFTNTIAMLSAPLLQPLVGYILDLLNNNHGHYTLNDYQTGLLIVPFALILASTLASFLPEKK